VERAGGREVCFLAQVTDDRRIVHPRPVARGNHGAVLAAARDANPGEIMVHNHPSGVLAPSDADLEVAARVYEEGLGTAITDNRGEGLYVVVEPPRPRHRAELDPEVVDAYLAPAGGLASAFGGYEDRPGQRAMARRIVERYNEGGVAVVEAGTGTGKSLAYLLPAALWALRNGERTVISTNTINLQEQLVGKDLPLVERVLGEKVTWALVKGRGNYVSIRRLLLAAESAPTLFEDDRTAELEGLRAWIETTDDGSLADLSAPPSDEVWEEVRSDGDICLKARCPHFQQCFYQPVPAGRERRRPPGGEPRPPVQRPLPPAGRRQLEHVGGASPLPPRGARRGAQRGGRRHLAPGGRGLPHRALPAPEPPRPERKGGAHRRGGAGEGGRGGPGPGGASPPHRGAPAPRRRPGPGGADPVLRRPGAPGARRGRRAAPAGAGDPRDPTESEATMERLDALVAAFDRLRREVGELRVRLEGDPAREERFEDRLLDLQAMERRLESAASALGLVLAPGEAGERFVRWVEGRGGRASRFGTSASPRPRWSPANSSATPSSTGWTRRFSPRPRSPRGRGTSASFASGWGWGGRGMPTGSRPGPPPRPRPPTSGPARSPGRRAPGRRGRGPAAPGVTEARVPSPFDYPTQALFGVPTDLPEHRDWRAFQEATARVTADFAEITGGGLFVLFTSHKALRSTAQLLRQAGVDRRFPLWVHGEASRSASSGNSRPRVGGSCSAPRPSGRGWTCRATRCGGSSFRRSPSGFPPNPSPRPGPRRWSGGG
jgi:hypothetical protein